MKALPFGVQFFEKIRNPAYDYAYVDKTDLIWRLANKPAPYFLSRPRRFGKSLMLSTLACYFRRQEELFRGLKLERLQRESGREWLEYPVIHFTLVRCEGRDEGDIDRVLAPQFNDHDALYGLDTAALADGAARFRHLVDALYRKFNRPVVILIDEYDAPLLQTLRPQDAVLHEAYRKRLRNLYLTLKELEGRIHFTMFTGVSEFSGLSLFSGLNNLVRLTLKDEYSALCGITRAELEETFGDRLALLAEQAGCPQPEYLDRLSWLYNGYHFTPRGEYVFNPFCLVQALDDGTLDFYWVTSGNATVVDYILPNYRVNAQELEAGLAISRDELSGMEDRHGDPLPFLYQTGYLTIREIASGGGFFGDERYVLSFPNIEVRMALAHMLRRRLFPMDYGRFSDELLGMKRALATGDLPGFMRGMEVFTASLATANEPADSPMREAYFRNALFTVLTMLRVSARQEVASAHGRSDCEVELPGYIYIFELKLRSRGTVPEALQQIAQRRYGDKFLNEGKPIMCVGAVFDGEGHAEWEAREYRELLGEFS
ncbi:MAG: hypothetical protein CSA07_04045 [Bacteroidia bacterium]|nr:MAG: hypothetical protein CSA07_04045 [Bacteroidia bacterium]